MSNTITLLLGLLVLAYLGSALVGKRKGRDFGLTSGAEYLVLGFLLGPVLLGLIDQELLDGFAVVSRVGAAWLALLAGLGHGVVTKRALGHATLGVLLTALVGAAAAAAAWYGSALLWELATLERIILTVGSAVMCCATTHNVSPWFARARASGPGLTGTLRDLARASALVPAIALSILLAVAPGHGLVALTWPALAGATLGTGVLLGILAVLLLGREFRRNESWGLLLGLSLLGAGLAVQVGLSAVATTFCLGLTVSVASRHAGDIRAMIAATEKPVMLPVALLAGAALDPLALPWLGAFIAIVLGARLLADLLRGTLIWAALKAARKGGPGVGLAMSATGGFTLAAAVEIDHALSSRAGDALMVLAAAGAVVGAVLGPLELRRALGRAGELDDAPESDSAPPNSELPSVRGAS